MAWQQVSANKMVYAREATITLPASATVGYSSVIDFMGPNLAQEKRYVTIRATASAVTGTNLDIGLYMAESEAGTKTLLLDAVVADIDNSNKVKLAIIDLNAYPAPYYFLGHTADTDESLNTITYEVFFAGV